MGVYELAIAGMVGSGMGLLVGGPLTWPRAASRPDVRAFGAGTVGLSVLGALISARLAGFVPDEVVTGHAINASGLVAFESALVYIWMTTGRSWPSASALASPLIAYAAMAGWSGLQGMRTEVPFAWLYPIVLGITAVAWWAWHRPLDLDLDRDAWVPPGWVVAFMGGVNAAQLARMTLGHWPVARAIVPLVAVLGLAAVVVLVAVRHTGAAVSSDTRNDASPGLRPAHYEHSGLHVATAEMLLARIDEALHHQRLFRRPDLSPAVLAHAVGSTPHLVSEALNRYRGTTFRDAVVRCRVDDVKAQLGNPDNDVYTIEGIAAAAGFRSRSAMYEAFKRFERTTPTAFRELRRRGVSTAAEDRQGIDTRRSPRGDRRGREADD